MTFLAGDELVDARVEPNADDLARQALDGCYWWAALNWWIRCDRCGRTTDYHRPERIEHTEDRLAWECAWIAWESDGGGYHHCAPSCSEQLTLDLGVGSKQMVAA
jgi:hypothetical protein